MHIHFAFIGIHHGCEAVENKFVRPHALNGAHYIAQLSYSAGFDENAIGVVLLQHLCKRRGEIPYEGATYASGVHFRYFYTSVLQETTVYSNFAKFVFNENQLFTLVGLRN
ncbi:hypothetical protein SDC9_192980 [bioreactor metagenome]|uniref:Uncharacterized protein n=1 Tax=bioreactor metagenome TaxID=1076179 RepID=A0A645IDB4_9ZZZZ